LILTVNEPVKRSRANEGYRTATGRERDKHSTLMEIFRQFATLRHYPARYCSRFC